MNRSAKIIKTGPILLRNVAYKNGYTYKSIINFMYRYRMFPEFQRITEKYKLEDVINEQENHNKFSKKQLTR